jgi:hypothetical protein
MFKKSNKPSKVFKNLNKPAKCAKNFIILSDVLIVNTIFSILSNNGNINFLNDKKDINQTKNFLIE